jgi:hypothetical protein
MKFRLTFFIALIFGFTFAIAQNAVVKPGTGESVRNEPVTLSNVRALLFEDLFNGPNAVTDLEARGWIVINQDGGGAQPPWFTPTGTVFPAFEGPAAGFVASNFQGANGFYIDHWLVSPLIGVSTGDTLSFYHRSPDGNPFDDSLYVKVSPTGGSNISDFTISTPRFLVSEAGWALYTYIFNVTGFVRFAIQYQIFDGGPSGTYSNYLGIDAVRVMGTGFVPVELTAFSASVSDKDVILNWATATETNNSGFNIERKAISSSWETIGFVAGFGTTTEAKSYSFVDSKLDAGSYTYRLKQIDFDGTFEYSNEAEVDFAVPAEFSLLQNYPNPFNPATKIAFTLPVESHLTLKVFNILGEEVTTLYNASMGAGSHNLDFDASNLNSGIYFYQLEAQGIDGSGFSEVKKMMLTK